MSWVVGRNKFRAGTLDTARKKEEADRQRVEKLREESANLKKHNGRSGAGRAQFRDEDVSQTEEELLKSMVLCLF